MIELGTVVQWFEDAEDATVDSRRLAERDVDYKDGKQLTSDELRILKERGQPPVVNNRIKPKIDYLIGLEMQTRTDPKALPRTPKHEEDAEVATDALRYVADANKFPNIRSECFEDGLGYGMYGAEVRVKETKKGVDIVVKRIPWDRIFFDPHSRERDFSDCKYKGIVLWMDKEDALAMFKGKEAEISAAQIENRASGDTFEDKPANRWTDTNRNRVRIVQMEYKVDGVWHTCIFTKGAFLVNPAPSPYLDENGDPEDTIVLQSAYVDRDGNRYGEVRQFIDMQDEINKRRSKGLHLINTRQIVYEKGAVDDIKETRRELSKPDGAVEKNPGLEFDILPTNDFAAGNFQMLQEAKQEIDKQGANVSSADTNSLSGRSRQILRQENNMEVTPLLNGLRNWENRIYRHCWNRIRQFWTDEKWIRVTDDEDGMKYVALNKRTTVGAKLLEQLQAAGEEITEQDMMTLAMTPEANQEVIENNVAELDVDIILDESPDTVTIQQEQFETIATLYPSVPPDLQRDAFQMLIESSSLRGKKKFLEKLSGKVDPQQQAQMQQQQMMQEQMHMLEMAKTESEIAKNNATATKSMADAEATINPPPDTLPEMVVDNQEYPPQMY